MMKRSRSKFVSASALFSTDENESGITDENESSYIYTAAERLMQV